MRLILLFATMTAVILVAGADSIRGMVVDGDGNPVMGAAVSGKQAYGTSLTDREGRFQITAEGGSTLTVNCLGYKKVNFKAKDWAVVNLKSGKTSYDIMAFKPKQPTPPTRVPLLEMPPVVKACGYINRIETALRELQSVPGTLKSQDGITNPDKLINLKAEGLELILDGEPSPATADFSIVLNPETMALFIYLFTDDDSPGNDWVFTTAHDVTSIVTFGEDCNDLSLAILDDKDVYWFTLIDDEADGAYLVLGSHPDGDTAYINPAVLHLTPAQAELVATYFALLFAQNYINLR